MAQRAKRFDTGKPPLDLIDPEFELELGRVMAYGGHKYGDPQNYLKGMPHSKSLAGALRHINAILRGEITCPESGRSHAVMAAWNMMVLYRMQLDGVNLPDDRWGKKGKRK